jgi:hypothetical protein
MKLTDLTEDGRIVPGVNTTVDVSAGEIKRQAKKFNNVVSDGGLPPTIKINGAAPNMSYNLGLSEQIQLSEIQKFNIDADVDDQVSTYDGDVFSKKIDNESPVTTVGAFDVYEIKSDKKTSLVASKGSRAVGVLTLWNDNGKTTSMINLKKEAKGTGLALQLYKYAIKQYGPIVSDDTQSKGSHALWKKLATDPDIHVYAWNVTANEFFSWNPDEETDDHVYAGEYGEEYENTIKRQKQKYAELHRNGKMSQTDAKSAFNRWYAEYSNSIHTSDDDIRLVADMSHN